MDESLVGKKLGNFEITGVLGYGGMAKVYRAQQPSMQRDVAVKVMNHELSEDEAFVKRFEREAEIFAELQHPHILPVIDFGRSDEGLLYIVFRYVEGGNLDQRIRRAEILPLEITNKILGQVASALTFAHDKGIIHRDIKTSNILLDSRDNAYLTDFGIARMVAGHTRLTTTNNIMGTPAYMAPEQWRGETLDARSDIYSLGVIVYEMLSGDLPYAADTPFTLMYKHVNEAPPSITQRQDLPPLVEAVVMQAMAKGPDERYQSAEAFADAFSAAVRGQVVTPPVLVKRPQLEVEVTAVPQPTAVMDKLPSASHVTVATPTPADKWRMPLIIVAVVGLTLLSVAVGALIFGGSNKDKDDRAASSKVAAEAIPFVSTTNRIDIYSVPNLSAPVVGQLQPDHRHDVIGISPDRRWLQISFADSERIGWVNTEDVEVTGDLSQMTVIELPQQGGPPNNDNPNQAPTIDNVDVGVIQRENFAELGLAFSYPERWTAEMVEGHIELEPERGPVMRDTVVKFYRGNRQALNEQLGFDLPPNANLGEMMPIITRTIANDANLVDFRVIMPTYSPHYPVIINSFEIGRLRHYVILIQYQEDDFVLGWAQYSPGIVDEVELQNLILIPILTTLTIDNNPLVRNLDGGVPQTRQPAIAPTPAVIPSRQPINRFLGG